MMLNIHTIRAARGAKHGKKRVGRGNASGHGTTATRGGKGQTARSGGSHGLKMKGFKFQLQSTPKLRGFTSPRVRPAEVYLQDLEKEFAPGATVNLAALQEKKLVGKNVRAAKVVATGELKKKLTVAGLSVSAGAKEKIIAAGGEVK